MAYRKEFYCPSCCRVYYGYPETGQVICTYCGTRYGPTVFRSQTNNVFVGTDSSTQIQYRTNDVCPKCSGTLDTPRYNATADTLRRLCKTCGWVGDQDPVDKESLRSMNARNEQTKLNQRIKNENIKIGNYAVDSLISSGIIPTAISRLDYVVTISCPVCGKLHHLPKHIPAKLACCSVCKNTLYPELSIVSCLKPHRKAIKTAMETNYLPIWIVVALGIFTAANLVIILAILRSL